LPLLGAALTVACVVVIAAVRLQEEKRLMPVDRRIHQAMTALHLPGRLGFIAFTLGPPLWEYGLGLLLTDANRSLGAVSAVTGVCLLVFVGHTVTLVGFEAEFQRGRAGHRASHHVQRRTLALDWFKQSCIWRLVEGYERQRRGEWVDCDLFEQASGSEVHTTLRGVVGTVSRR
jgi:hypothetical protein